MEYHIIDAFTEELFSGNPAGVCLLNKWPTDALLQSIATENNLSETAFLLKQDGYYDLRWFTPVAEVDLCGHATLASAFVLFEEREKNSQQLNFKTLSGMLSVTRDETKADKGLLYLDFPAREPQPIPFDEKLQQAMGVPILECHKNVRDTLLLLESEEQVQSANPNFDLLKKLPHEAVIITAQAKPCSIYDFVSRFFAPEYGIPEDPVTGSAHSGLIPFWTKRLNKKKMTAKQLSKRGGVLYCEDAGERAKIGGYARRYLRGFIEFT